MMEHSQSLAKLAPALIAAQAEMPTIPKDGFNPFFQSKYAALPDVKVAADPVITKHGLCVSQTLGHDEKGDTLTTMLLHVSGEFIRDTMQLHLVKVDPQGQGSATTYARRYSYMSILGLVADEDDDGNNAQSQPKTTARKKESASRPSAKPAVARPKSANDDKPLLELVGQLNEAGKAEFDARLTKANFPPVEEISPAAEKQCRRWIVEINTGAAS